MVDAFTALWEAYRAEHDAELAAPHSILSITSITYLDERPAGIEGIPGRWSSGPDGVRIDLAEGEELADDHGILRGPGSFGPVAPGRGLSYIAGRILIEVFHQNGYDIVRPRDPERPVRRDFRGTPAYRPDRRWVVDARWHPGEELIHVESFAERLARDVVSPGRVTFRLEGREHTLTATPAPGDPASIALLFRDATSGVTTSRSVRELIVKRPAGDELVLDFNRARNKNCAYSDFAICPLPPAGNVLDVAVEAGERLPFEREPGRGVLIGPEALARELASAHPPAVLDVRWRLDRPDGRPDHLQGHVPGAVYVDLDHELAAHGEPGDGRHPLPAVDALQEAAQRWGLHDGQAVVVYDDLKSLSAGRAWWLLRAAGVADVRILDGGWRGWVGAGLPVETGETTPAPGDVVLSGGALPTVTIDEAAAFPGRGVLLDARAGDRYRGETEPVDPRAGHIPGAVSAPTTENVDADGRFLPADELRARFAALGVTGAADVAVYCGSGVTAAHEIAALEIAGIPAALLPGSWSQWSNHPERPAAVGAEP